MIKKIIILILLISCASILKRYKVDILSTFSEKEIATYHEYHISYENENLTTNNLLSELEFLKNEENITITIVTFDNIRYDIRSNSMKSDTGKFFDNYIKLLEKNENDKKIIETYSNGIRIKELIIYMPDILANNYLQNKNLEYWKK